jgi:DUF971 family protein
VKPVARDLFGMETKVMTQQAVWPTEIRLLDAGAAVRVAYDDGASFDLPAEYLRVQSPSAEVRGHGEHERKTVGGKRLVRIVDIRAVGNYAVRFVYSDGHDTGLYTWGYLRELGATQAETFSRYLSELAAKGLDRDRPGEA